MLAATTSVITKSIAMPPTPSGARQAIKKIFLLRPSCARSRLASLADFFSLAILFQDIFPDEYSRVVRDFQLEQTDAFYRAISDRFEELLSSWFPFSEICDGDIFLEFQGGCFCWDSDPEAILANPEECRNDSLSWLCQMIHFAVLDEEDWRRIAPILNWPETLPAYMTDPDWRYDSDLLEIRLKEAGLGCIWRVWAVANNMTGNEFLDINPYDETLCYESPHLTKEDIFRLRDEWAKAKLILDKLSEADDLVSEDPRVLQQFIDIFNTCQWIPQEPRPLMEVFTDEDGGNDDPITSL